MRFNIEIGNEYKLSELKSIFGRGFFGNGINVKNFSNGLKAIFLFSTKNEYYEDRVEGDILYYTGEGKSGDQKLSGNNNALINSNSDSKIIYGFKKEDSKKPLWTYLGLLQVIDYNYVSQNGRMVYEFKIKKLDIGDSQELKIEKINIENESMNAEPKLVENRDYKINISKIKIRSAAFKVKTKENYKDSCAICGKIRYTKAGYPEVQAAHIYPVEKDGSDDLRNGLALCTFHHWAFDGGLFVIEDNYQIKVLPKILNNTNYDEINKFNDQKIRLPQDERFYPAEIYLKEHRKLHKF